MRKTKRFYSLKSYRRDKAAAKKFGDIMDKIISNQNRYREIIYNYFAL